MKKRYVVIYGCIVDRYRYRYRYRYTKGLCRVKSQSFTSPVDFYYERRIIHDVSPVQKH